jgi:hypothetical protein
MTHPGLTEEGKAEMRKTMCGLVEHETLHLISTCAFLIATDASPPRDGHTWGFMSDSNTGEGETLMRGEDFGTLTTVLVEAQYHHVSPDCLTDLLGDTMVSSEDLLDTVALIEKYNVNPEGKRLLSIASTLAIWLFRQNVKSRIKPIHPNIHRGTFALDASALWAALQQARNAAILSAHMKGSQLATALADEAFAIGDLPEPQMVGIPPADWPRHVPDEVTQ